MPSDSFTVWLLSPLLFQSANLNVYGFFFLFFQFLADHFVSEPAFHFPTGRTVMAKVCFIRISLFCLDHYF